MSEDFKTADSAPAGSGMEAINNEGAIQSSEDSIDSSEPIKDQVENAIENGATKAEIKQMIREYEIKVNGKKEKVKLDLSDENAIKKHLQLARAGQGAMQEKAELEKMIQQAMLEGKQDPWKFMQEYFQMDPDDMAEQRIQRKIDEMKKSPEQLQQERMQKELEQARRQLQEIEKQKNEEQSMRLQERAASELDNEIKEALANEVDLPKTRKTVRRICDAMLWAMDQKDAKGRPMYPDIKVRDVLPAVKSEIKAEFNEFVSELPEDLIEAYIGKKNLDKLRKRRIAAVKETPNTEVRAVAPIKNVEDKPKEKKNMKDFFRNL